LSETIIKLDIMTDPILITGVKIAKIGPRTDYVLADGVTKSFIVNCTMVDLETGETFGATAGNETAVKEQFTEGAECAVVLENGYYRVSFPKRIYTASQATHDRMRARGVALSARPVAENVTQVDPVNLPNVGEPQF